MPDMKLLNVRKDSSIMNSCLRGVLGMSLCWSASVCAQETTAPEPAPNPAVVEALQQLASMADGQPIEETWDKLRALNASDPTGLIQGLVYAARDAGSTRQAMVSGAVIKELGIPDGAVIRAVVPLLETEDDSLKKQACNVLGGYENQSAERPPDFSAYREIIAESVRQGKPLPLDLIEYMYERSPGLALRTMMRALAERDPQRIKTLLWAEHVVAGVIWKQQYGFLKPSEIEPAAAEQLDKLAQDDAWWVRLYVAEVVGQHRVFETPNLKAQLQADDASIVRQSATWPDRSGSVQP